MRNYHRKIGPPRCAFKVDIQKAYDTVDWQFLKTILVGFGFHPKMFKWIMVCVTGSSFSICVNGNIHGWFEGKRGLRQGDPLSPYLFTLVMEVITLILQRKLQNLDEFQYHNLCDKQKIINLCFADDLFLFARGHPHSVSVIMDALEEFKNVSGLVPSILKSTAFFCNVPNAIKVAILSSTPFTEGVLPVSWGWRKLLQIRSSIRPFIWHRLHNGMSTFAWFDKWDDLCPLKNNLSNRDIIRAGFSLSNSVHVLHNDREDVIMWRDRRGWSQVWVLCDLNAIPPRMEDSIAFLIPLLKGRSIFSIIARIVLAATTYYLWIEQNSRLFKKKISITEQVVQVICSIVRLKLVTFKFKKVSN
ncbi:putative RNA-directed DNA polymerase, eukaryota, reverse transcriptase zinc-binding domain protein [Tanacetum coccineum]